ncbi:MAG: hypothetical protein ACLP1Y_17075 [Candidatus Acidiferrales bacterium]
MNVFSGVVSDVGSMITGVKDDDQKRAMINAVASAEYSQWISFLWRLGQRNLLGLGPALRDAATSCYLSLRVLEKKNFLALAPPKDLLAADNLARFQTEEVAPK